MKLYTHRLSPFSAKVRIALDEKGLACEEIALPITRHAVLEKPAEMLAINPRAQVPVLIDGDVRLYDSTVILEYLEERTPRPALFPSGLAERARARQLEDYGDWLMSGCVGDLIAETYRKPDPAAHDAAKVASATAAIQREHDRLERELAGRDWLAGAFGVADISCFVPLSIALAYKVAPSARHPQLGAWLARTAARPSCQRELASMREALAKLPD